MKSFIRSLLPTFAFLVASQAASDQPALEYPAELGLLVMRFTQMTLRNSAVDRL